MRVFGLTGGIASGKSFVADHFRQSIPVIDADQLAREVVVPNQPALEDIARQFGAEVLLPDGTLNRKALGARVFSDPVAREELNAIVHPRVGERLAARLLELGDQGKQVACYEVPLLFESKLEDRFRPIVLVAATPKLQVERIVARDGLSEREALARINSQMPLAQKQKLADYVIDNNGSVGACVSQADSVLSSILAGFKTEG